MSDSVFEYLATHHLLTLATASRDGVPHAAPCFYASDGAVLYFSTSPESLTAKNLAENPLAAVAVADDPGTEWSAARGAQIAGSVTPVAGDETETASRLFSERYPHLGQSLDGTPFFRLDPHDVRFVDNSGDGEDETEALGVHWKRSVVYRVFRHLRPDELKDLTSRMETQRFPAGSTLIEEGTEADKFFVIVDGNAEATSSSGGILSALGPGCFAGEIAILRGGPRTATVTATTDVTAVTLSKGDLEKMVSDSPELRRELEDVSAERMARD